jgi:hypothetical protein
MNQKSRTGKKVTRPPLLLWLLASVVVLSACAQVPMETNHPSAVQSPKRERDAEPVIKEFLGTYAVVDSRFNHKAFDKLVLELNDDIPTLKIFKGEDLSITITANDCAGDLINKFSNNKYLACFSGVTGSRRQRSFRVSAVPVEETYKQGTLLSTMKPMVVQNGYLIIFDLGNAYESEIAFSVKKL